VCSNPQAFQYTKLKEVIIIMGLFDRFKKASEGGDPNPYELTNPIAGEVVDIAKVKDEVFNSGMLGKGVGVIAACDSGIIEAPISGTVSTLFPTLHAIGITTKEGVEVLIHIGVNTVDLNGEGFKSFVKQDQTVKRGEPLVEVSFKALVEKGYDMTVMLIVTNTDDFKAVKGHEGKQDKGGVVVSIETAMSFS